MRARLALAAIVLVLIGSAVAQASGGAVTRIRAVYRAVLTAEYFGPARAVCSHLTRAGVRSFTAGRTTTCGQAFREAQRTLTHKSKNVDNAGYTRAEWRAVITTAMAHLKVRIHGRHATATGGPGQTKLVNIDNRWLVDSYPPSVGP
ncbi:MAG: hypothetical protein QOJ25_1391 [Solirubrobacteraceae bacterium]|nr:hypothetical protein [Solirubrobacteraceae bacterium]